MTGPEKTPPALRRMKRKPVLRDHLLFCCTVPPCLSLWERGLSAAKTERVFVEGRQALSVTCGDSSPRGRAKGWALLRLLPEGEPRGGRHRILTGKMERIDTDTLHFSCFPAPALPGVFFSQQSLAPAGMASSTMMRWSFSSPFSVWTAESSMPRLSWPIILRGGRLTMATKVLPMSCSGS